MPQSQTKQKDFPYQDLSLRTRPGERWLPIRDFEGYYEISSHGRIKSLAREAPNRWGKSRQVPERILRLKLVTRQNKTVGMPLYALLATLYRDGGKYAISVGRLLYDTFVERIDLEDKSIFIGYKDKDGRNTKLSNLYKTNVGELKRTSYEMGRSRSDFSALSKSITQFNSKGEPIARYSSMYEAGRLTGIESSQIAAAVQGRDAICHGYFWREGHSKKALSLDQIKPELRHGKHVNRVLMERLGMKRLPRGGVPAFLNLSLEAMEGERWKPVPGYEGLYEVSNKGRVKSLRRMATGKRSTWVAEKIKMPTIDFLQDESGEERPGSTLVGLYKDRHQKVHSIARLVYYCFVRKFDLADTRWRVYYKDGNTLNLDAGNLMLRHCEWSATRRGS